MFKLAIVVLAFVAAVCAKPGIVAPFAYTAPVLAAAPGVVTATSSQVIARNFNGIAAAPVAYTAPFAYSAPLAYTAPLAYSAASQVSYSASAPVAAPAFAPLRYTAGPVFL